MLVVIGWLLGTAFLDVLVVVFLEDPADFVDEALDAIVECSIVSIWYIATLAITAPLLARAMYAIQRPWPATEIRRDDLAGLSPGLRDLVTDARVLRVVLESRDESTLPEVWNWQRRFEQLAESDRRELEHLGLGDPGISDLLRWTVAAPKHAERGMTEIIRTLEQFEQRLLDSTSLFRGPFR